MDCFVLCSSTLLSLIIYSFLLFEKNPLNAQCIFRPQPSASSKSSGGGLFGVFKGLVGSKMLNEETLEAPLEKMREHLIGT